MTQTSLIKALSLQWDLRIGPYRAFFPNTSWDISRCLSMHPSRDKSEADDYLKSGKLLAACENTRTGKITAFLELVDALELCEDPAQKSIYNLGLFNEEQLSQIAILSAPSIFTEDQKSIVAQILISHCFIEILKAKGQALIISCDIGYFSIYKRLGLRPIGSLQKPENGTHFLPMIFLPDQEYLSLIHSPILDLLRGHNFNSSKTICDWYYRLVRENSELQIGSAFSPENEEEFEGHNTITEGLSDAGREVFLSKAMVIKCREDEVLITENDGGKSFGYIQKGLIKVLIGDKTVVMLGEGDIFGEIAYILDSKRTAKVVAVGPDTEIVLFSASAINALEDDADKMVIWRNLARVLAQRVVLTNKLLG